MRLGPTPRCTKPRTVDAARGPGWERGLAALRLVPRTHTVTHRDTHTERERPPWLSRSRHVALQGDLVWALCQDTKSRLGLVPWHYLWTPQQNSGRRFSGSALAAGDGGGGGGGLEGGLGGGLGGGHGGGGGLDAGGAGGGGPVGESRWTARRAVCRTLPWEVELRAGEVVDLLARSTDAWWLVSRVAGERREIGYVKREHLQEVESCGATTTTTKSPPAGGETLDVYMAMSAHVSPATASAPRGHTENPEHEEEEEEEEEEEDIYMVLTPSNSTSSPTPPRGTPVQEKAFSTCLRENFATVSLSLHGKVPEMAQALSEFSFLSDEERAAAITAAAATGVEATGGVAGTGVVNKLILMALARGSEEECELLLAHAGLVCSTACPTNPNSSPP
ncbi:uncharacterized protein LOC142908105 [Petromyzon marinus]|uniref:uncharacterized protein LOC142908105 n=1 Tax=Petromyzon marinus TaxID=7757 RepID=UPI003F701709